MPLNSTSHRIEGNTVLVLERTFNAPRSAVFNAFKDPAKVRRFWAPQGWEVPVCNIDFQPGGVWTYCMRYALDEPTELAGVEAWGKAFYRIIDEPRRLVYTDYFTDAAGTLNLELPATEVAMEFIEVGATTRVVSRSEYASPQALREVLKMGAVDGASQSWDRLAELLRETAA